MPPEEGVSQTHLTSIGVFCFSAFLDPDSLSDALRKDGRKMVTSAHCCSMLRAHAACCIRISAASSASVELVVESSASHGTDQNRVGTRMPLERCCLHRHDVLGAPGFNFPRILVINYVHFR